MSNATHRIIDNDNGSYSVALLGGIDNESIVTTFGEYNTFLAAINAAQSDAQERSDSPAIFHTVPNKFTVIYFDDELNIHVEKIESFRTLAEIEPLYYSGFDVERVYAGWGPNQDRIRLRGSLIEKSWAFTGLPGGSKL